MTKNNKVVIFDVDGTLANCDHRLHYIRPVSRSDGKRVTKRFDLFEKAIPGDVPIDAVCDIYRYFVADPNVTVILLTGRNDSARNNTIAWFTHYDLDGYDELIMKPTKNSFMPDTIQKGFALDYIIEKYGVPAIVFEDRARVVAMWKERGIFVANVEQHE